MRKKEKDLIKFALRGMVSRERTIISSLQECGDYLPLREADQLVLELSEEHRTLGQLLIGRHPQDVPPEVRQLAQLLIMKRYRSRTPGQPVECASQRRGDAPDLWVILEQRHKARFGRSSG